MGKIEIQKGNLNSGEKTQKKLNTPVRQHSVSRLYQACNLWRLDDNSIMQVHNHVA